MMIRYFQLRGKHDLDPDSGASTHDHRSYKLVKPQEKVLQSPEILEVILKHIFQQCGSTGGQLCTREARRLRLVCKSWLLEINFLFQRQEEPLVFVGRENLKQFLAIRETSNWDTPPICLSLGTKALFDHDFCENLRKLFSMDYFKRKLTGLRITVVPSIQGTLEEEIDETAIDLPDFISNFKFSNLRQIWLKQLAPSCGGVLEDERVRIPRLEHLLRKTLDESENLTVFEFEGEVWRKCPAGQYEGLILPRTVTRVQLDTRMDLTKTLGMNSGGEILKGITILKLTVTTRNLLMGGEMERILEVVRMSVEQLELDCNNFVLMDLEFLRLQVVFRIPMMERLKRLRIGGKLWRVESSHLLDGLGDSFPQLEQLEFCNGYTDELLLSDWCGENSVFGDVTTLKLKLMPVMVVNGWVRMTEAKMRRILKTFPNVENLWMGILEVGDMEGVKMMFGELGGQLRSLHLDFRGYVEREEEVEGLLIGGDVEMVRRLKSKTRWNGGKMLKEFMEGGNGGCKSLRDLVNLEELELVVHVGKMLVQSSEIGWFRRLVRRSSTFYFNYGCETLFEAGFMRMPKLRKLVLRGGLDPGEKMAEKWKRQGSRNGKMREVEFNSFPQNRDGWWFVRKCRWYIFEVVCWLLLIYRECGGIVEESVINGIMEQNSSSCGRGTDVKN